MKKNGREMWDATQSMHTGGMRAPEGRARERSRNNRRHSC